jgi:hypothetical protein
MMQLVWTQLKVSKHFPRESLKRGGIPHHIHAKGGHILKMTLGRAQGLPTDMFNLIRHLSWLIS